jgi:hypothetical protein
MLDAAIKIGTNNGKSNIGIKVSPRLVCIDIIEIITPSVDIVQLIVKALKINILLYTKFTLTNNWKIGNNIISVKHKKIKNAIDLEIKI